MNISVATPGRFHTFDLARQMQALGHLGHMYTFYPRWKVDESLRGKADTFPWLAIPQLTLARAGLTAGQRRLSLAVIQSFSWWVARRLQPCDVFHCLSSFGIAAYDTARQYGALIACDRGSSHIGFQDEILAEEYQRWGVDYPGIDPRVIEREIAEYEHCDMIFVPSSFVYRTFVKKGVPETKLRKSPYGVDLGMFRPHLKDDDVFRVIYVGSISLRKGIPYLLAALAPLKLPKFELWLIGSVQSDARRFMANYESGYRYLGTVRRSDLHRYYSQGSVFVLASIEEGLALVQAQAMACGLPVIATTNSGAEDLFTDGIEGFIVPIRDPEAIREKVIYLYEHPEERQRMGQAALRRVRSLGGWSTYGERMASYYREALMRGSSSDSIESCDIDRKTLPAVTSAEGS